MSLKQLLRKIRISIGKQFLDKKSLNTEKSLLDIKKILFLRQDGKIGDSIVSSFVFREIKKQNPNTHIGVVCSNKNAFLFERNPYIDQLHFVKNRNILERIKCGLNLRKLSYDVLIDPTVLLRNRDLLFLRLINAKCNIGYQKADYKIFDYNIEDNSLHFSQVYQKALEMIGFKQIDTTYDVPQDKEISQQVRSFLNKNSLDKFIAVNFYGNGSSRRFNDERIVETLHYLTTHSEKPILLLAYPEVINHLEKLAEPFPYVFIDKNSTTIYHSIEAIKQCCLLISPDTATVHIGTGFTRPMICFYSNDKENFAHWHPNNPANTHILRYQQNINELSPEAIKPEWLL
ncbi:glycosyltransferase family 9 protein [Basfia succiniciproducens]|uniref:glycosyltransferase family 9 protein n=1 Tax=Basfia succiniciproducens TaxID=653940 RepID=UPI003FCCC114